MDVVPNGLVELLIGSDIGSEGEEDEEDDREAFDDVHVSLVDANKQMKGA